MQFSYLKCTFSSAKIWWSWMAKQKPPMYTPRKQPQQITTNAENCRTD